MGEPIQHGGTGKLEHKSESCAFNSVFSPLVHTECSYTPHQSQREQFLSNQEALAGTSSSIFVNLDKS